jgi:hypothetical protein
MLAEVKSWYRWNEGTKWIRVMMTNGMGRTAK